MQETNTVYTAHPDNGTTVGMKERVVFLPVDVILCNNYSFVFVHVHASLLFVLSVTYSFGRYCHSSSRSHVQGFLRLHVYVSRENTTQSY